MPQLEKQRKGVFGWILINKKREGLIPPEAFVENGFIDGEYANITRGSKSSGGFGIAHEEFFNNSILNKTKSIATIQTGTSRIIKLPCRLNINPGGRFLICRGSYVVPGFIKSGPFVLKTQKRTDFEVFYQ